MGVTEYIEFTFVSRNATLFAPGRVGWKVFCVLGLGSLFRLLHGATFTSINLAQLSLRAVPSVKSYHSYDVRLFDFRLY